MSLSYSEINLIFSYSNIYLSVMSPLSNLLSVILKSESGFWYHQLQKWLESDN